MIKIIEVVKNLLEQSAQTIVNIVLIAVCFWLLKIIYTMFSKRIESNETKMSEFFSEMSGEMKKTRDQVEQHSSNLGKATKAISGDFLKMRESIFNVQQDFFKEATDLKKSLSDTRSDLLMINQKNQYITEKLNEKNGKIIVIEKNIAKVLDDTRRHEDILAKAVKAINQNIKDIHSLKKSDDKA